MIFSVVEVTAAMARQGGTWAAERGDGPEKCPMYGPTEACAELRREWTDAYWKRYDELHPGALQRRQLKARGGRQ
ncbi:MAG TPA: hypothetical protein VFE72_02910 [Lysobacter sp.]|nr:hypothetical protein [Lysobacter sp.]